MALDTSLHTEVTGPRGETSTYYLDSTIDAIPGLRDLLNQGEGQRGTNDILTSAMSNPVAFSENNLLTALQGGNQDQINANLQFLNQQGLSTNQIQTDVQNLNTQYQQNASSSGGVFGNGFIGGVLNSLSSPTAIASMMANAVAPGSGALIPLISSVASGKENLTQPLENLAISGAISGTGLGQSANSGISNQIQDLTGASPQLSNSLATGALSTVGSLASGQNLQNALTQGTISGLNSGLSSQQTSSPDPNSPNYIGPPQGTSPLTDSSGDPLPSTITSTLSPPSPPLDSSGGLTQTNSGNGLGNTLPMSPSNGTSFDPTAFQDINSISQSVTSGSTDPTAQDTTGLPPIDTTQPNLNDITQEVAPTDASGNPNLTAQILPSGTDIISTVNNFDGTSTVTYADGSTQTIETPNSAPNYDGSDGASGSTKSGSGGLNVSVPNSSSGSSSTTNSASSSGSSSSSSPSSSVGSSAYNPLTAGLLSTGTVLNKSPLEQALGATEAPLEPVQLNQLYSQSPNPYMPQNISEGTSDIQFSKDGGSMGGLGHYEHKPEFVTGHTGYYAQGGGTGQSDDIPALLKDGDYVMDADIVAALGDGSNKAGAEALHHFMSQFPHKHYENHSQGGHINAMIADGEFVFPASLVTALGGGSNKEGAKKLDEMREKIREHKRSASANKIPPKAKSPLSYMEKK